MNSDEVMVIFFLGYGMSVLHDVLLSLTNYLNEKAWRINDYEKILYKIFNDEFLSEEDYEPYINAVDNHKKRLERREKLDRFLSKFRRKKDV